MRFRQPLSNPWEQVNKVNKVNKQKYFVKWIEIQTAAFKFSRTSEQGEQSEQSEQCEQSEQTQIPKQMNWDSDSLFQILENKWTRWTKWTNKNALKT